MAKVWSVERFRSNVCGAKLVGKIYHKSLIGASKENKRNKNRV